MPCDSKNIDLKSLKVLTAELLLYEQEMMLSRIKGCIEDYIPMYGMLLGDVQLITLPSHGTIKVNQLLYDNLFIYITYGQEIELNELDILGFKHMLYNCQTENEVFENIERRMNEYADYGGIQLHWIKKTLSAFKNDPENFPPQFRDEIQQKLLELRNEYATIVEIDFKDEEVKVSVKAWALYYYYLHEKKYKPRFELHERSKTQAIKDVAYEHSFSAKSFELKYNLISKNDRRLSLRNRYPIMEAIQLLGNSFPAAVNLAEDELKLIELRYS